MTPRNTKKQDEKGGDLYKSKLSPAKSSVLKKKNIFEENIRKKERKKKNPSLPFGLKEEKKKSTPLTFFFSHKQGGSWDTINEKKCLVHKHYQEKSEGRGKSENLDKVSHCLMSADVDMVIFLSSVICRHQYTLGYNIHLGTQMAAQAIKTLLHLPFMQPCGRRREI